MVTCKPTIKQMNSEISDNRDGPSNVFYNAVDQNFLKLHAQIHADNGAEKRVALGPDYEHDGDDALFGAWDGHSTQQGGDNAFLYDANFLHLEKPRISFTKTELIYVYILS